MHLLKRILVIGLAAVLVAAGAYAVVQAGGNTSGSGGAPAFDRGAPPAGQTALRAPTFAGGRPEGGHLDGAAGGAGGLAEVAKNLGIVGGLCLGRDGGLASPDPLESFPAGRPAGNGVKRAASTAGHPRGDSASSFLYGALPARRRDPFTSVPALTARRIIEPRKPVE